MQEAQVTEGVTAGKRWKVVVHLKTEMGARALELNVDSFAEIDRTLGDQAAQVVSVHVAPRKFDPAGPIPAHVRSLN